MVKITLELSAGRSVCSTLILVDPNECINNIFSSYV